MMTRYLVLVAVLMICATGVGSIFWFQEVRYTLPTPLPANYKAVQVGEQVLQANTIHQLPAGPLFLHFYNPDCPCSRFNARHMKTLIRAYHDSIQLYIIVPSASALEKASDEFGAAQNYYVDKEQAIAKLCGVYSTPQAAVLD